MFNTHKRHQIKNNLLNTGDLITVNSQKAIMLQ